MSHGEIYFFIKFIGELHLIFETEMNSCCLIVDRACYVARCSTQLEWIDTGINLVLVGTLVFYKTLYQNRRFTEIYPDPRNQEISR